MRESDEGTRLDTGSLMYEFRHEEDRVSETNVYLKASVVDILLRSNIMAVSVSQLNDHRSNS